MQNWDCPTHIRKYNSLGFFLCFSLRLSSVLELSGWDFSFLLFLCIVCVGFLRVLFHWFPLFFYVFHHFYLGSFDFSVFFHWFSLKKKFIFPTHVYSFQYKLSIVCIHVQHIFMYVEQFVNTLCTFFQIHVKKKSKYMFNIF